MNHSTSKNLLFGLLALQLNFVSREALVSATAVWLVNKSRELDEILLEQKALQATDRQLLKDLVERHLKNHGGDPQQSLASLHSIGTAHSALESLADPDLAYSLAVVGKHADDDQETLVRTVGALTSTGARFQVLRPHARGGLGQVFVAKDLELNREVALKEILPDLNQHDSVRLRFLREAEITGGLEHPGIVPVYGLGSHADGSPYYAMRFIRGDSLQSAIDRYHATDNSGESVRSRHLQLRSLLRRFVDVCNALAYAHSRGVLHRDLKPGNIMLGRYGETLVVDWGLAKCQVTSPHDSDESVLMPKGSDEAVQQTALGQAIGTPAFMSPEQAQGHVNQLNATTDVYSLGATLYILLTGRAPFEGPDAGQVLQRVISGDFPPPRRIQPNVPKPLDAICLKAMALRAEDRYQSPQELSADIESFLADEPIDAWQEPWHDRARRWMRKHQTLASSTAVAVVLTAIGLATFSVVLASANDKLGFANQNLSSAIRNLKTSNGLLAIEKKRSEDRLAESRQLVEDWYMTVSDDQLLANLPELLPLRRQLLQRAQDYYVKTIQESNTGGVRLDVARASWRLADLTSELDPGPNCLEHYERAYAIYEELRRANPDALDLTGVSIDLIIDMCDAHSQQRDFKKINELSAEALELLEKLPSADLEQAIRKQRLLQVQGLSLTYAGQERESLSRFEDSANLARDFHRQYPGNHRLLRLYCHALTHLVWIQTMLDKNEDALTTTQEVSSSLEELVAANPPHPNDVFQYASALRVLGLALAKNDDIEGAIRFRTMACERLLAMSDRYPHLPILQEEAGDSCHSFGLLLRKQGKPKEAIDRFQSAITRYQALEERYPNVPAFIFDIAMSRNEAAIAFSDLGHHEDALAQLESAIQSMENISKDSSRLHDFHFQFGNMYANRARARSALGKLVEAASDLALAAQMQALALKENPNEQSDNLMDGWEDIRRWMNNSARTTD